MCDLGMKKKEKKLKWNISHYKNGKVNTCWRKHVSFCCDPMCPPAVYIVL